MQQLIDSVESALKTKNWYAALTLTLTLPDISGKLDNPLLGSNKRYAIWFDEFVAFKYKAVVGANRKEIQFLSGNDCYALRCSYLHEGKSEIKHQRAREVLDDFEFVIPPQGWTIHMNQINNKLQLQVDIFCRDIITGINQWLENISCDSKKQSELNSFLKILQIK